MPGGETGCCPLCVHYDVGDYNIFARLLSQSGGRGGWWERRGTEDTEGAMLVHTLLLVTAEMMWIKACLGVHKAVWRMKQRDDSTA